MKFIFSVIMLVCAGLANAQSLSESALKKLFTSKQKQINDVGGTCEYVSGFQGDLDGDKLSDVLVYFACTMMPGANMISNTGWAVWVAKGRGHSFILADIDISEKAGASHKIVKTGVNDASFIPIRIDANGVIDAKLLAYKKGDPSCCPSIEIPKKVRLINGSLVIK